MKNAIIVIAIFLCGCSSGKGSNGKIDEIVNKTDRLYVSKSVFGWYVSIREGEFDFVCTGNSLDRVLICAENKIKIAKELEKADKW